MRSDRPGCFIRILSLHSCDTVKIRFLGGDYLWIGVDALIPDHYGKRRYQLQEE